MTSFSRKIFKSDFLKGSSVLQNRAEEMVEKITPFLIGNKNILDIGSGTGHIANSLSSKHKVTALDVEDLSVFEDVQPVIYDGKIFPFKDKEFDVSILITVLHHTQDPEKIISEAKRVSREIIIVEDVYSNSIQKYLTYFMDSIVNFEFFNHPHTNKSSDEWKDVFVDLNLKVVNFKEFKFWYFFKGAIFHLKD